MAGVGEDRHVHAIVLVTDLMELVAILFQLPIRGRDQQNELDLFVSQYISFLVWLVYTLN
jgi:hypothetical protein